ncbi:MAG: hypothetical protein JWR72_4202 [Flavisolibacter sp.]|jgi:hypothetical protein|nr:hypothetical protein [Flavisolibacter sp.]
MKPVLLFSLIILIQTASAQSLDYISIRKKNGRSIKSFYTGSAILLQTIDGGYLQGPIKAIRNDSIYITFYDIRSYPTTFGTYMRDTVAVYYPVVHYKEIKRIHINSRRRFLQTTAGPILMIGGAGYLALNILNGALYNQPITDKRNLRSLGIATGAFGLGYLINRLFSSDGFNKKSQQIVYVNL